MTWEVAIIFNMENFKNKFYDSLDREIVKNNSFLCTAKIINKLIETVQRFKSETNNKSDE